jgi:hypothetical protein
VLLFFSPCSVQHSSSQFSITMYRHFSFVVGRSALSNEFGADGFFAASTQRRIQHVCCLATSANRGSRRCSRPSFFRVNWAFQTEFHFYMRFYSALAGERLWSFWHQYLHLPLPVLTLPLDKARPASSSFQADAVSLRLSEKSTSTLRLATERFGTTMQTVLMAAFQTFLFRYTGQDDILIGSPVSARADSSIYDILGQFLHFCFCVFQFFTSEYDFTCTHSHLFFVSLTL